MLLSLMLAAAAAVPGDSTPGQRLAALADAAWEHDTEHDGAARLRAGLAVLHLPDLSEAGAREAAAFWRKVGRVLETLPPTGLSDDEIVTRDILVWRAAREAEAERYFWFPSYVSPYAASFSSMTPLFAALPVKTAVDRSRYLALMGEYAEIHRQLRRKLEGQVKRRLVLTRPDIDLALPMWRSALVGAEKAPIRVAPERLAGLPDGERKNFERAVAAAWNGPIRGALDSLVAYLEGPYRAAAPEKVGQWQYPGGKDYYRYLVRLHTTVNVTPEAVFRTGERQIDSLFRELDRIRAEVGFKGTVAEFKESLRTERRFYVSEPDSVGARLDGYVRTMEPKVDSLFGFRPKAPYAARRLALELEPNMTYGFYDVPRPGRDTGVYYFNGSKLDQRNLGNAEGLAYHELVPGHHFQIMTQRENKALSRFRQDQAFTAYMEGWGDYASMLGTDAGLYRDPYSRAGRLVMEMMTGTRLVLDVGMNYLGWPLDKARQYMRDHTLETDTQIATETLRYSADIPGQALAYRMGSLAFRRIREKAKAALGDRWDVRRFHRLVLESGAMPLDVLERRVDRFVLAEKRAARPSGTE